MNKKLKTTITRNQNKIKEFTGGVIYIDCYNKAIWFNGLCGTITAGISSRNEQFIGIENERNKD